MADGAAFFWRKGSITGFSPETNKYPKTLKHQKPQSSINCLK